MYISGLDRKTTRRMKRKLGRERATSVADLVNDLPLEEFVEAEDLTSVSRGCVFENKSEVRFIPTWQPVLERIAIALERIADNLDEQHQ